MRHGCFSGLYISALLQNEMGGLVLRCEAHELVGPPPPSTVEQKLVARLVGSAWPPQQCPVETGEQVVERMAMGERSMEENVVALLLILVVFRLLAFVVLRRRFRRK